MIGCSVGISIFTSSSPVDVCGTGCFGIPTDMSETGGVNVEVTEGADGVVEGVVGAVLDLLKRILISKKILSTMT